MTRPLATWADGAIVPEAVAGNGVFETFVAARGRLGVLNEHLARLAWAAGRAGCAPLPPVAWHAVFEELLERSGRDVARGRLVVGPPHHAPRLVATVSELYDRAALRARGVTLSTVVFDADASDPTCAIKHCDRGRHERAARLAARAGADDALWIGPHDEILETTRSNLFVAGDRGGFETPTLCDALLPGIARRLLIAGLRAAGVEVRERVVPLEKARDGRPVLATNAVAGVVPIRAIDGVACARSPDLDQLLRILAGQGVVV